MKRYRLDPNNPRQLTPEEARALDEAPIDYSDIAPLGAEFFSRAKAMIDWSQCPDVESVEGRCSGAWVAKDSRVMVQSCILDHAAAGYSAAWGAENFELPVEQVRRILRYAHAMTETPVYFSVEDELAALLLQIVLDECSGDGKMRGLYEPDAPDALYNYDQASYADAMIALHEQGLIEITEQDAAQIWAKLLPQGRALLDRFHTEQERNAAASWRHRQRSR